jgi:CreA protein
MRSSATMMALFFCVLLLEITSAHADDIGCLDTTFKLLSPNDSVCVPAFDDSKVRSVTCHISQARKGGWGSVVGLAEDPSGFSNLNLFDQGNWFLPGVERDG